jgi:hypothetical protein
MAIGMIRLTFISPAGLPKIETDIGAERDWRTGARMLKRISGKPAGSGGLSNKPGKAGVRLFRQGKILIIVT